VSDYLQVLNRRIAVQRFQPASNISSQELYALIEEASLAPSSFNLEHPGLFLLLMVAQREHRILAGTFVRPKMEVIKIWSRYYKWSSSFSRH
jgi:nitroreductase